MALLAAVTFGCESDSPLFGDNRPPLSDAGDDRVSQAGQAVLLDGSGSLDEDGEPLAYAWVLVSGPAWVGIEDASLPRAVVVPTVAGEYTFRLMVTDGTGASASDEMRILVVAVDTGAPENTPPVADAGGDRIALVGSEVLLSGLGSSDADGDELRYAWVQVSGPVVAVRQGDQSEAVITPAAPGEYEFLLTVVDGEGASATDRIRLLVAPGAPDPADPPDPDPPDPPDVDPPEPPDAQEPPNEPPRAHAGADHQVYAEDSVRLDGSGSLDPEGDELSYAWVLVDGPDVVGIDGADGTTAFVRPTVSGRYQFRLTVVDSQGASATALVLVDVAERVGQIDIEGVFTPGSGG